MEEYRPKPKGAKIIGEQINNGITKPEEIAQITGYSLSTVRKYLSSYYPSHRIRTIKHKEFHISKTTKQIMDKLNEGKRQSNIARQFGVSRQRVHTIYNKYIKGVVKCK